MRKSMAGYGKYAGKSEEERRSMFEEECAKHPLADQLEDLKKIEGFPIGKDEDILALSDTPYYTACPNPYINEFIEAFGTLYDPETDDYERTPFVSDVSEGKNDPIYMAHTYHTKVPYKAIMRFIEHYTKKGDLVFDGFCGTGMTGFASQKLQRSSILCDLSPIAAFLASGFNKNIDFEEFHIEGKHILDELEKECGWMYETLHLDTKTKGKINYVVWSDVFICPYCKNEYNFWDAAVEGNNRHVKTRYSCPNCNSSLTKIECERSWDYFFDSAISQNIKQAKQIPVLINYFVGKSRFEKRPDENDLKIINDICDSNIPYPYPTFPVPKGDKMGEPLRIGILASHHFFTKRNLWVLASYLDRCQKSIYKNELLFVLTSFLVKTGSKLHNIGFKNGKLNLAGAVPNALYIPSLVAERNIIKLADGKLKDILAVYSTKENVGDVQITTGSCTNSNIKSNSIDYIFTDPPFGANLMYSELNFIWESWLKIFTNNESEAIINNSQNKKLEQYKELMLASFKEYYRILKPNRWITVEFHNSKASVWNAIQDSLSKAGFIIAQVAILDKKQGTFNQMVSPGAVEKDLVINAYKPHHQFEEHFLKKAGAGLEKDFVAEHLSHLPVEPNIERTEQMLYSKMLAHYIQNGFEIRLNARQFYHMLKDHFKLIDGYWFLDDEVARYDEWKKKSGLQGIEEIAKGQQTLFVSDEKSMFIWLYNFLSEPKTYSDIYTTSRQVISSVEDALPELKDLLETNFIFEDGKYRRPDSDRERDSVEERREKELLRAFEKVLEEAQTSKKKKIKEVRKEAVALGFTKAYQEKRFEDILTVAKKLDKKILENNSEINDFVEIAELKVGDN